MTQPPEPRVCTRSDVSSVAQLLDAFNREYDDPTPGPEVLERRLVRLLAGDDVIALLVGDPAVGVALLSICDPMSGTTAWWVSSRNCTSFPACGDVATVPLF